MKNSWINFMNRYGDTIQCLDRGPLKLLTNHENYIYFDDFVLSPQSDRITLLRDGHLIAQLFTEEWQPTENMTVYDDTIFERNDFNEKNHKQIHFD